MKRKPITTSQPDIITEPIPRDSTDGVYRYHGHSRNSSVRSLKMFDFTSLHAFIYNKFPGAEMK